MLSRVLDGTLAPAEPITWQRFAAPQPRGLAPVQGRPPEPASAEMLRAAQARISALEEELERREKQAFASGFRKGEEAGREQGANAVGPLAERLARTLEELSAARRKLRREAEEDVVKLALAIARRILMRELSVEPAALLGVVKAALDRLEGREVHRVRVHPADAALLRKHLDQTPGRRQVEVLEDARLERGAAVFETPRGDLDASVDSQLQEIQRGLADRMHTWHERA